MGRRRCAVPLAAAVWLALLAAAWAQVEVPGACRRSHWEDFEHDEPLIMGEACTDDMDGCKGSCTKAMQRLGYECVAYLRGEEWTEKAMGACGVVKAELEPCLAKGVSEEDQQLYAPQLVNCPLPSAMSCTCTDQAPCMNALYALGRRCSMWLSVGAGPDRKDDEWTALYDTCGISIAGFQYDAGQPCEDAFLPPPLPSPPEPAPAASPPEPAAEPPALGPEAGNATVPPLVPSPPSPSPPPPPLPSPPPPRPRPPPPPRPRPPPPRPSRPPPSPASPPPATPPPPGNQTEVGGLATPPLPAVEEKGESETAVIVGVVVGVAAALALIIVAAMYLLHRKRMQEADAALLASFSKMSSSAGGPPDGGPSITSLLAGGGAAGGGAAGAGAAGGRGAGEGAPLEAVAVGSASLAAWPPVSKASRSATGLGPRGDGSPARASFRPSFRASSLGPAASAAAAAWAADPRTPQRSSTTPRAAFLTPDGAGGSLAAAGAAAGAAAVAAAGAAAGGSSPGAGSIIPYQPPYSPWASAWAAPPSSSQGPAGGASAAGAEPSADIEAVAALMGSLQLSTPPRPVAFALAHDQSTPGPSADAIVAAGAERPWEVEFSELRPAGAIPNSSKSFKAVWKDNEVAVRRLGATAAALPPPVQAQLQDSASVLASLHHTYLANFFGFTLAPPCIITEYCGHGSLSDLLARARTRGAVAAQLTWPCRLMMALHAAAGVEYLHTRPTPILHGELTSTNLLVDDAWRIKVTDFNTVRSMEDAVRGGSSALDPASEKLRWLAPEVLQGGEATTASDSYAFGIVLWELLTWQLPWERMAPQQLVRLVPAGARLEVPPVARLPGPDTASFRGLDAYIGIMRSCWAQAPGDRPSFAEIILQLRVLLEQAVVEAEVPLRAMHFPGGTLGAWAATRPSSPALPPASYQRSP